MGLFKSIKKAIKKIGKGIKKVVKKTVGAVKKVVKKVSSSKILRALVGGALLFTGIGGLASRFVSSGSGFFGTWANAAGQFAGTKLGAIFRPAYNLSANIFGGSGPFGGAGPFARPLLTPPTSGPLAIASNVSGVTSSGTVVPISPLISSTTSSSPNIFQKIGSATSGVRDYIKEAAKETGKQLIASYAKSELLGPDPTGVVAGGTREPDVMLDPIQFAYQNLGVNPNDAYNNLTYGTADVGYASTPLYQQETLQVG